MNPEKIVKYSVPFFVIAIISRSIEEISFFYYAVPVMCLMFIVLLLQSSRFSSTRIQEGDPSTPLRMTKPKEESIRYPESNGEHPSSPPKAHFTSLNIFSARGGFHFAQHLPSSIILLPFLLFLLPGLWFLLTSLWSSYPEVSATRALYFILISTGCISAGVLWIRYSGRNIFELHLPANVIVVLICVFSILTDIPSDSWTAGHGKGFIGFFGHQNLLASVLLFTLPSVLYRIVILAKSRIQRTGSDSRQTGMTATSITNMRRLESSTLVLIAYSLLLTANLLLIMLTYSRSAILSLIFGVIVFLILNRSWKVLAYGFATVAVLGVITYSIPSLNQFADRIIKKDFPEVYSSRLWMWEPSYKAALEGGSFGLGYGISHSEIRSGEYSDRFENGRLIREKGNSSLALIEETGLIGLSLFMLPILLIIILSVTKDLNQTRFFSRQDGIRMTIDHSLLTTHYSLLTAALTAFILHAQFEAWWVGVGSVQLPLFLLYIGLTIDPSMRKIRLRSTSTGLVG